MLEMPIKGEYAKLNGRIVKPKRGLVRDADPLPVAFSLTGRIGSRG